MRFAWRLPKFAGRRAIYPSFLTANSAQIRGILLEVATGPGEEVRLLLLLHARFLASAVVFSRPILSRAGVHRIHWVHEVFLHHAVKRIHQRQFIVLRDAQTLRHHIVVCLEQLHNLHRFLQRNLKQQCLRFLHVKGGYKEVLQSLGDFNNVEASTHLATFFKEDNPVLVE